MKRLLNYLKRFFYGARPFPLFNLYLIYFGCRNSLRFHRKILIQEIKTQRHPAFLILAILNGFVWYTYRLWKVVFVLLMKQGKKVQKGYNISLNKQFKDLMSINLLFHIPIQNYYKYKFYKKENYKNIHNFISLSELPYFHDFINSEKKDIKQTKSFISNKYKFSTALLELNIPTIETICIAKKGTETDRFFIEKDIFCKPVRGSQSKNAFKVVYILTDKKYEVHPIIGKKITTQQNVRKFIKKIIGDSRLIIQKCLDDHSCLSEYNESEEISTARIITAEFKNREIKPIYVQLEY